ncbi:hypothetical protein [Piscirickettsia salmonis]|nr:hypothetical protein [Piscirickettsia salmonis]AKP73491.1 hypothetical protein PSLF89_1635 [Piscirickettsia salmonis LF-89 = ATCC VR-1361]ALY02353.1 hypothetical protein AWE47_05360 [Piscirickettsia salmonis]AMA41870.1 hypothetical protein AWJ11_05360 [Piscirickettsia salmonis]AOS34346.1 hypothetical protein AVM72_02580 [Piscirickettsia salmonis]APS61759.1 hypothetical protein AVI53_15280 [Piscirickettsia salmonis]
MIKVIKENEGAIVTKGQETILLTGSIYDGSNLGKSPAIIALSELGSGLFCAKATLQSENSCLSWLQELKETLGNEITFHLTGKQSKEDLAELQILCQQAEIEAQFPIPEKQPLLYSLATGVNANGIIEKEDLYEKTGGFSFSLTLTKEIEQAISELEKKIKDSWFTINTKGRTDSIILLKELKQNLEQLGESYIGPVNSESDLKFPKSLKEAIKDYSGSEAKNGRQQTTTVGGLLKTLDFHFTRYTVLTTKFTQVPVLTATWHTSEPSADTDSASATPMPDINESKSTPPPPPPAELKAGAKARREEEAAVTVLTNAMEFADDNAEDLPPPPPPSNPDLQQPLPDFNDSDFPPPPPPPPPSDEEQMPLADFDDIELPPPPPMDFETGPETQVSPIEEVNSGATPTDGTGPDTTEKKDSANITAEMQSIMARRGAIGGPDSETEAGEDDSWSDQEDNSGPNQSPSTLFQRQQSQSQEADNSNPLQYN